MKKLHLASAIALLCAPHFVNAAEVTTDNAARLNEVVKAGFGIEYKARIQIDKLTIKNEDAFVIKTDDTISPAGAPASEVVKVGFNKSMGWNDILTNPDIPACSTTVTTGCLTIADIATDRAFGWGHSAHWYLIDLNKLAGQKVHVHVMVERYDDGVPTDKEICKDAKSVVIPCTNSDDDLVPALTVWLGNQDQGSHWHWFPNKLQATQKFDGTPGSEFWARKLSKPSIVASKNLTYELKGVTSTKLGYDTAYDGDKKMAMVEGIMTVSKTNPNQNFLTVALGGDDRDPTKKHDVNYKLTVEVHKPHTK